MSDTKTKAQQLEEQLAAVTLEKNQLRHLLYEAYKELSGIEAITVSMSDTDGLMRLLNSMRIALRGAEQ